MNLPALPDSYVSTRDALHQVAFFAISPARYKSEGRMGLRAAPGGFGTPEFNGSIARIEVDQLVFERDSEIATQQITTVRDAATFFGVEYEVEWFKDFHDPLQPVDPDTGLDVDDEAARVLGQWFNFGFDVLNELRRHGTDADDVSEVQLWPEHFDPAAELGSQGKGQRASFGASPGDGSHQDPYVFVAPWSGIDADVSYWNAVGFNGAILGYSEIADAGDPHKKALDFLLEGYNILHAG